jgi:hypothetical protein
MIHRTLSLSKLIIIIWGDFIVVHDYILDTANLNSKNNPKAQEKFISLKKTKNMKNNLSFTHLLCVPRELRLK